MVLKKQRDVKNKHEDIYDDLDTWFENLDKQNPSNDQVVEVISKLSNNKKQGTAIELQYAKLIEEDKRIAVAVRDENATMYEWTGSHWKRLTEHEGKQHAMAWLKAMAPERATNKTAGECYRTALLVAKALPPVPEGKSIIPLVDRWLLVGEAGQFTNIEPSQDIGITYEIGALLESDETQYVPQSLPQDTLFARFLNTSLPDKEVQELVQEYSGYTLINDTRFQKALVNTGEGSNGKSQYLEIISALHKKVASMRLDSLDGFGTYGLLDASLAISAEAPKKGLNEELLKACITGDKITIEGKHKNQFEYNPNAKWVVACNRFPKIHDESNGLWRRLLIVDWKVVIEEGSPQQIRNLSKTVIEKELIHVVNWCLEGLQRLLARGKFNVPGSMLSAIEREKEISNTVIPFTKDAIVEYSTTPTLKEEIYGRYREYCEVQGFLPYGNAEFWTRIKALFPKIKEERKRVKSEFKRYVYLSLGSAVKEIKQITEESEDIPF